MGRTVVLCPHCGGEILYSDIMKQIMRRKHDKDLVLKIVTHRSPAITGKILEEYNKFHRRKKITLRHLHNILKELKAEGKITGRVLSLGRYGRTTLWKRTS